MICLVEYTRANKGHDSRLGLVETVISLMRMLEEKTQKRQSNPLGKPTS